MENKNSVSDNKINEFIQVYPPIKPKTDFNENKKYLSFFSKGSKRASFLIPQFQLSEIQNSSNKKRNSLIEKKSTSIKDSKIKNIKDSKRKSMPNNAFNIENVKDNQKENKNRNEEYNCYFIEKDIQLRKNKSRRTGDIKIALESFLRKSDLIERIRKFFEELKENSLKREKTKKIKIDENPKNDEESEKFMNSYVESIITKLSENVVIEKYKKNEFVIKMNEIGDDCYFLVSGELSVLKPVEYHIEMKYDDYIKYLSNLLKNNELELINILRKVNQNIIDVGLIEELKDFIKSYFIVKFNKEIENKLADHNIFDYSYIEKKIESFNFTFEDFNLKKETVFNHINEINQKSSLKERDLKQYINKILSPTQEDYERLNVNKYILEENKYKFTIFKYEDFMFLKPGCFFGESALDSKVHKRNASIRTEEDCIILSLKNEIYQSLLSENNKKLKSFDVLFICGNFFFNDISPVIFTRRYFSLFKLIQNRKNDIIYNQSDKLSSVYFIKEGNIKLEIYASIIDVFNLIKYYYDSLSNNPNLKIDQNLIKELKEYSEDKNITDFRHQSHILKEQLNLKRKFELYTSNSFDTLGLEEFFLDNDYIGTCRVISNDSKIFEISKDSLNLIIKNEKQIDNAYYQLIEKKLISIIKRLHVIKINYINQLKYKIKENFFGTEVPPQEIINGQTGGRKAFSRSLKKNSQPKFIVHCNNIDEELKEEGFKFIDKSNLKFYSRNNFFENYDLNYFNKKSKESFIDNSIKNFYNLKRNEKNKRINKKYKIKLNNIKNRNIDQNYINNIFTNFQKNYMLSTKKNNNINIKNNKTEVSLKISNNDFKKKNTSINTDIEKEKRVMETTIIKVGKDHLSLKEIGKRMKSNLNNSNSNNELCIVKNLYNNTCGNMKKSYFLNSSSEKKKIKNNNEIENDKNNNRLNKINKSVGPINFKDILSITSQNKFKLTKNKLPRINIHSHNNFSNLLTSYNINNFNKNKMENNNIFKSTNLMNKNSIRDNHRTFFELKKNLNAILTNKENIIPKEKSYSNIRRK